MSLILIMYIYKNVIENQITKILDFPEVKEKIKLLNESGRKYELKCYVLKSFRLSLLQM